MFWGSLKKIHRFVDLIILEMSMSLIPVVYPYIYIYHHLVCMGIHTVYSKTRQYYGSMEMYTDKTFTMTKKKANGSAHKYHDTKTAH